MKSQNPPPTLPNIYFSRSKNKPFRVWLSQLFTLELRCAINHAPPATPIHPAPFMIRLPHSTMTSLGGRHPSSLPCALGTRLHSPTLIDPLRSDAGRPRRARSLARSRRQPFPILCVASSRRAKLPLASDTDAAFFHYSRSVSRSRPPTRFIRGSLSACVSITRQGICSLLINATFYRRPLSAAELFTHARQPWAHLYERERVNGQQTALWCDMADGI